MTEKTITILGKEVRVRYCAAAENGFEQIRGKSIYDIDIHSQEDLVALSISSIVAAYARTKEDAPITADDLLYDAKPQDLVEIVKTVIELRNEWYGIPAVVEESIKNDTTDEEITDEQKND